MVLEELHLHDLAPTRWPKSGLLPNAKAMLSREAVSKIDRRMTR